MGAGSTDTPSPPSAARAAPSWAITPSVQTVTSAAAFDDVVAVFELEKAAYEIVYEANNRPSWITIPERGLRRAAARLERRESGAA